MQESIHDPVATMSGRSHIESELAWVRLVEQFDQDSAAVLLDKRLRSDAAMARSQVLLPSTWPGQPSHVARMMRRSGELVRFDRITELVRDGDRVFDVGCGHGVIAACIARRRRLGGYLGVDLNRTNIASARQMAETNGLADVLRFEVGDAAELDQSTIDALAPDIVLLLEILEHLNDPIQALRSVSDRLPSQALVVFSVPLVGRIEACWGHRMIFGADAIVGLAEAAGLTLQHVDEIHNTWALAAASRSATPPAVDLRLRRKPRPATLPRPIRAVALDRVEVDAAFDHFSTDPHRWRVTATPDRDAILRFSAASATMLRIDVEPHDASSIGSLSIELRDRSDQTVAVWTSKKATLPNKRQTIVLRQGWPSPLFEVQTSDTSERAMSVVIRLRARRSAHASITIWRIGFGPSDSVDPVTHVTSTRGGSQPTSKLLQRLERVLDPPVGLSRRDALADILAVIQRASTARRRELSNRFRGWYSARAKSASQP